MSDNFLKIVKVQNSDGTYSDAINIVTDGDYVTCYNGNDLNTNLRNIFSTASGNMTNTSDIKDNIITFTSADTSSPSNFLSVDVFTTGSKSSVLFNNISKMSSNIRFLNNNKLDKTGDAKSNVVTFISDDTQSPSNFLSMNVLSSGSTIASLFNSMSKMASNIRFLNNNRVDNKYITKSNDGILVHDSDSNNGIKIYSNGKLGIFNQTIINKDLKIISDVGDTERRKIFIDVSAGDRLIAEYLVKNNLHEGAFHLSSSGKIGIWSATNSTWAIYIDANGEVYCPNIFSSSLRTLSAIGTGGKTAYNDTQHDGVWLTTDGKIHLTAGESSGGGIGFHFNRSANVTTALTETSSGKLTCSGGLFAGGVLCTGGKTLWNDTEHSGTYISTGGEIHISKLSGGGGLIGFHFNGSASSTTTLNEASSGVLTCSGLFLSKNQSTSTITDIITVNSTNATIISGNFVQNGKIAQIYIKWQNKNAITVPSSGNITNFTIGTIVAGKRPLILTGAWSIGDDAGAAWYNIATGGAISLGACEGTGTERSIAANTTFHMCATYILP